MQDATLVGMKSKCAVKRDDEPSSTAVLSLFLSCLVLPSTHKLFILFFLGGGYLLYTSQKECRDEKRLLRAARTPATRQNLKAPRIARVTPLPLTPPLSFPLPPPALTDEKTCPSDVVINSGTKGSAPTTGLIIARHE